MARLGLVAVLACGLAFGLLAGPAFGAKFVHRVVAEGSGLLEGEWGADAPQDVAVNRSGVGDGSVDPLGASTDGYVYVIDDGNHRVQVFDADGNFRFMFGGGVLDGSAAGQVCDASQVPCTGGVFGSLGGMFNRPKGIAVDQATGHVFVRERPLANPRVQEFTAAGEFVRAWGWDVVQEGTADDTAADELETCFVAADCQGGSRGSGLGQFGFSFASGGGIDVHAPSGDVLVADPANGRVQRFDAPATTSDPVSVLTAFGPFALSGGAHVAVDAAGTVYGPNSAGGLARYDLGASAFLDPIDVAGVTGSDAAASTAGLEVDPVSGNLLVARDRSLGGGERFSPVFELGDPGSADVADVSHVDTHVDDTDLAWNGIGFDADGGTLYVASNQLLLAAKDGPAFASTVFGAHSDVGATSATVNATIDSGSPLGVAYRFEVASSSDPADFEVVADGEVAGGSGPVDVSAVVSGLEPGTLYLVRIVTRKLYGNPEVMADGPVLLTKTAPPDVQAVRATAIGDTSARLVGLIDPNGTLTRYRFEWGADELLGRVVPVPDGLVGSGFDHRFVSEPITGLEPATTYWFRLVATSDTAGQAVSAIGSFTTDPVPDGTGGRVFELVSPADKLGGTGVGEWYRGPASLAASGFAAHVGERFAALGSFGSTLLDSPQAYANDWALADRVDSQSGWVSHSPVVRPNLDVAFASFLTMDATSGDLSRLVVGSNNTLRVFPELTEPEWSDANVSEEVPFLASWGGPDVLSRWEFLGPNDPSLIVDEATAGIWQVTVADGGSHAVAVTRLNNAGVSAVQGLAGSGDPTGPAFGDLVAGRSVYVADISGELADSFAGTGERELVNLCSGEPGVDRTALPAVDGAGDLVAQECAPPDAGRDERLVSARGAALQGGELLLPEDVVSGDGRRVFFLAPDPDAAGVPNGTAAFCASTGEVCPAQLFVRQDNGDGTFTTRWISQPEGGLLGDQDASLLGATRFEGATPDGDKVLFRTNSPLTADDPNSGCGGTDATPCLEGSAASDSWDLYLYDFPDDPTADIGDGELVRVSAGPDGDGDCVSPYTGDGKLNTTAALRFVSDDGARVLFACTRPLAGTGPAPAGAATDPADGSNPVGETNLYLYDSNLPAAERWRFVARVPRSTSSGVDACASTGYNPSSPLGAGAQTADIELAQSDTSNCVRGSRDGGLITMFASGRLTIDDPASAVADVFAYEPDRHVLSRVTGTQGGAGGTYLCAPRNSPALCHGDGGVDDDGASIVSGPVNAALGVATDPLEEGTGLVFFQSQARLTPDDTDDAYDVYEWRDGELSLLTPGTADHALYKGNDVSGRNVFFASRERLSWQDFDAVGDIYTARVDGGIAQPAPPEVCDVLGGGCHVGGGGELDRPPVESTAPGGGNVDAGDAAERKLVVRRPGLQARRRAARRGVLAVAVRAPRAGRVRAVARARLGGRARIVGRGRARVGRAGRTVVRLRLNRAARRRLRAGRRLVVVVRVAMPGVRPQWRRVPLRIGGRR